MLRGGGAVAKTEAFRNLRSRLSMQTYGGWVGVHRGCSFFIGQTQEKTVEI